ncbi:MAG TPA: WecB/TagA/CpsF family glycosyltransferase, partial [Polymorphobacter sp.]|nr:WecB/TagA/CpsF family glycosyltransferase [Polymorphobacter sp.]
MPKQERVARLMKHGLHQDMAIACGGAILDFLSGHVTRAPGWMRRSGLEWMYRLSLEPKRLFGRYVVGNPLFLLRSAIMSGRPPATPPAPRPLPVVRAAAEAYGIGGPLPVATAATRPAPQWLEPAPRAVAPRAATTVVPFAAARSEFSANRPVIERDDLFGRQHDLDQLLSWVLDQSGNALIYGPRGYGKTSLVRVFGEIADSKAHVVLYASCSSQTDFTQLMRSYISEIPDTPAAQPLPADGVLTVQQVAGRLASVRDISLVIILDEFDRIGRDDTRESIVELIKDVSDLTAAVRFVLVGVATDVVSILGYHPSVHRCLTCVPVARLGHAAVETLFRHKAAADRLSVPDNLVGDIVRLTGGSA